MDRVCIFIDGSNFYHALKGANLPVRVDLGKLGLKLTETDRKHSHTYFYNAPLIRPRRDDEVEAVTVEVSTRHEESQELMPDLDEPECLPRGIRRQV